MPELYDDPTAVRRRRKGGRGGQPVAVEPDYTPTPDPQYETLGHVWKATHGSLLAGLAWEVAKIPTTRDRLERAARLLARDVEIPPAYLLGDIDLKKYVAPSTVDRCGPRPCASSDDYGPEIVEAMLRKVSTGTVGAIWPSA